MSCAFQDCGREDCPVCRLGRQAISHETASTVDPLRDDATAEPAKPKPRSAAMPKRRHRQGPHR
jgi:hypothetical protein